MEPAQSEPHLEHTEAGRAVGQNNEQTVQEVTLAAELGIAQEPTMLHKAALGRTVAEIVEATATDGALAVALTAEEAPAAFNAADVADSKAAVQSEQAQQPELSLLASQSPVQQGCSQAESLSPATPSCHFTVEHSTDRPELQLAQAEVSDLTDSAVASPVQETLAPVTLPASFATPVQLGDAAPMAAAAHSSPAAPALLEPSSGQPQGIAAIDGDIEGDCHGRMLMPVDPATLPSAGFIASTARSVLSLQLSVMYSAVFAEIAKAHILLCLEQHCKAAQCV